MENISLTVVTEDREYGRTLSLAMLNVCRSFIIRILSKGEFVSECGSFYRQNSTGAFYKKFDLILWDGDDEREACGDNMVLLAAKPSLALKDFGNRKFRLYKYSSAQSMVSDIFEIYGFVTGRKAVNLKRQSVKLLAFASWAGGTGCTTLAMSLAQELCRFRNKRVMYLCMEEIESTEEFMECHSNAKGVGVYLYRLFKSDSEKRSLVREKTFHEHPFLDGYVVHDPFGVEAFAPTKGKNPLKYITTDELQAFIASIIDSGRYDVIIIDMGNCLSEVCISCVEMAEKICLVSRSREASFREAQYCRQLICSCGESIMDKVIKVVNMFSGEQKASDDEDAINDTALYIKKVLLPLHDNTFSGIELEGRYGQDICTLADKMTEPFS